MDFERSPLAYVPRLLTAADLAALPEELPSGTVRYELENGELRILPPHTDAHAAATANLVASLLFQGQQQGFGKARAAVAIILRRNPDHVLVPDGVFLANRSLPTRVSPEDFLISMPDLVVEVCDRSDTAALIGRRVDDYLAAGVRVVWVADPAARTVTAHRRDAEPQVFLEDDTLTVEDVIPGFRLLVRDALQE
jgi:Uma2 family endonuclease